MLDCRDLMKDLRNQSRSSLIYTLLMANVLSLAIFLSTNRKEFLNKIQGEAAKENMTLRKREEELHNAVLQAGESKNMTEKESEETVRESESKSFLEMFKESIERQISSESPGTTPQEDASKAESASEPEDKPLSKDNKEKIINFEEAAKGIRSKDTAKEKPKTLVWHFPKAISRK